MGLTVDRDAGLEARKEWGECVGEVESPRFLFSKPGPGTYSHRQQIFQMDTSLFMGLGTTVVQTIPQRGHPQG